MNIAKIVSTSFKNERYYRFYVWFCMVFNRRCERGEQMLENQQNGAEEV